ncbi:hypothetical protein BO70DRAFT_148948 [Aspergillus heteromorphus CBS 117.55]|uniref:Uncharacterized protein n=1 Tax=Aspergillus heteromorphus CBS 117.55 TaxID=1448321 RepID=A0A317V899_9EURO|nr:uncharacterized protein BO70DRAFT_148948 [Aspergillus heteromorphus CBS 117.55]PWY69062.1 hypothetical protein BO70DRAFT_148948 [Aspergillus heteromorphus CBS 117.55]
MRIATALLALTSLSAAPVLASSKAEQCAVIPEDVIVKPLCDRELQASYREYLRDGFQTELDKAWGEERDLQSAPSFYGIPIPSFATSLYERLTQSPEQYDVCPTIADTIGGLKYRYEPSKEFPCCRSSVKGAIERAVEHFMADNEESYNDYAAGWFGRFDPDGRMDGILRVWKVAPSRVDL